MTEPATRVGLEARFTGQLGTFRLDCAIALPGRGVTVLTGPSGCGKTTLLRCVAGLERLDGQLMVDGEVWQDAGNFLPPHRRQIGVVFQDARLLPHLSVQNNLIYGQRRTSAPQTIALDEVVQLLGLKSLMRRSTSHLSGGERQRVALGRALLSQPRLLLLDEPLSNLDGDSKAEILQYLERLFRVLAIPALYVSHDQEEVDVLADHLLTMQAGRIVSAVANAKAMAATEDRARRQTAARQLAEMTVDDRDRLALAAILGGLRPA